MNELIKEIRKDLEKFIGKDLSEVDTIKKLYPGMIVNSIPAGGIVTMDLRYDRIRVFYDSHRIIKKITIG